jgi:serine/threonine protein kinase
MKKLGEWELIEPSLGRGGQGTVYKARSAARTAAISSARNRLRDSIKRISNSERTLPTPDEEVELNNLISSVRELSRDDRPAELGALKEFDIPSDNSPEAQAAIQRLRREVDALQSVHHRGILKLLDANVDQKWLVTEYHPGGTLSDARLRYKGDTLAALKAFLSIVEAVAALHEKGYVHRDIKSSNVFIAADGRLVLGDFGIVFRDDSDGTRLTEDYERVGSRDWMAPWAHTGARRIDEVDATFDVFPLGKLLWVMVTGERILPSFWTHQDPGFTLKDKVPGQPGIEQVSSILDKCIVRDVKNCFESAAPLRQKVLEVIDSLEQKTIFEELTLAAPEGDFKVRITLGRFQLTVTPMRRNDKGDWIIDPNTLAPLARWQLYPNKTFVRLVT